MKTPVAPPISPARGPEAVRRGLQNHLMTGQTDGGLLV
jgi:hypothetical protein